VFSKPRTQSRARIPAVADAGPVGRRRRLAVFLFALASLAGCSHRSTPPEERIAILRFENLGGDPSYDWIGRGLSELLTEELSGRSSRYAISSFTLHNLGRSMGERPTRAPGVSTEDALAFLAGANEIGYGDYVVRGGRLEAHLYLEDVRARKYRKVVSASGPATDVVSVANNLARQIVADPSGAGVRNSDAVMHYVDGLEAASADGILADAQAAIAADPGFIAPYRMAAEWYAARRDTTAAAEILSRAFQHAPSPIEKARLDVEMARLTNDPAARLRALEELATADAGNPEEWQTLAEAQFAVHHYSAAAAAFRKLTALDPRNQQGFNLLGYSLAYGGDVPGGVQALERYQALAPDDPNPIDSTGDVYLLSGHPREAETYYLNAYRKNPKTPGGAELFKAAVARLMTGDVAGATGIHERYLKAIADAPDRNPEMERIEWMWTTGERQEACRQMLAFARAPERASHREMAARAFGELAMWMLLEGDRTGAAQTARNGLEAGGGAASADALLAAFLAQPAASAEEWKSRSEKLFRNPGLEAVDQLALACALLIDGEYQPAASILEKLYDDGARTPADEGIPAMLAWALMRSGRQPEAEPLLAFNPIPPVTGFTIFTPFYFPRIYDLRAKAAEKSGRTQEAQENERLYRKLSGPQLLVWDR